MAPRFDLSPAALRRHKAQHLPTTLSRAREADEFMQSSNLLHRVREIHDESMSIFREAKTAGDHRTALQALDKAARMIELLVKLKVQLEQGSDMPGEATVLHVTRWVDENGDVLGETPEPPFIADGPKESYIGALRRARMFAQAEAQGLVNTYVFPGPREAQRTVTTIQCGGADDVRPRRRGDSSRPSR